MRVRTAIVVALVAGIATIGWSDQTHARSIADVLSDIRTELGLAASDSIDADAVPSDLMIELGEAVMTEHAGSEARHEWMDEMMGGEGSASLDAAHTWMAYQYLAGGYEEYGRYGMGGPMMGSTRGTDGWGMMYGTPRGAESWGMMGNPAFADRGYPVESPRDILDRRYASGEISRREYQQMIEDIE